MRLRVGSRGAARLGALFALTCMPVPAFAAAGLSVPLPTPIYRLAVVIARQTAAVSHASLRPTVVAVAPPRTMIVLTRHEADRGSEAAPAAYETTRPVASPAEATTPEPQPHHRRPRPASEHHLVRHALASARPRPASAASPAATPAPAEAQPQTPAPAAATPVDATTNDSPGTSSSAPAPSGGDAAPPPAPAPPPPATAASASDTTSLPDPKPNPHPHPTPPGKDHVPGPPPGHDGPAQPPPAKGPDKPKPHGKPQNDPQQTPAPPPPSAPPAPGQDSQKHGHGPPPPPPPAGAGSPPPPSSADEKSKGHGPPPGPAAPPPGKGGDKPAHGNDAPPPPRAGAPASARAGACAAAARPATACAYAAAACSRPAAAGAGPTRTARRRRPPGPQEVSATVMQRLLPPWRRAAMRRPLHAGADAERPPRLVLRFAILSAVSLGVAAAAILGVTRSLNVSAAKQNVAKQMSFAAGTALADAFSGADLTRVPPEARRRVLDRRVERIFSSSDAVLVLSVAGPTGRITYSTDHRLIGRRLGAPGYFAAALGIENHTGHVISVEGRVAEPSRPSATRKTLDVYAPLFPHDDGHGVVLVSVDYSRVVAAAMKWFYPVAGILEATLVLLYALLMPLLLRVSRKLRQQLERIRHQAYHDDLTGLPNRLQFRDRVDAACREADAQRCAVMIVDLNRFKEINDTLGHRAGDELLRDLALRLKRRLPDEILVARLGGDEFGVLAPIETVKDAVQIAREIEQIIGENVQLRDIPLGVEGSIGIALAPDHGRDVDTVMQHADLAMYDAKARLGPLTLYSEELDRSQKAQGCLPP